MISKHGEMTTESAIELLLAIAAIVILITIAVVMFVPSYDGDNEIASAYFDNLKDAVEVADSGAGKVGSFFMLDDGSYRTTFFLVYFDNAFSFKGKVGGGFRTKDFGTELEEVEFFRSRGKENVVCICYFQNNVVQCPSCDDLKFPARADAGEFLSVLSRVEKDGTFDIPVDIGTWNAKEGARIKVENVGDEYVFSEF